MRVYLFLVLMCGIACSLSANDFVIRGKVSDKELGVAIEPAVVTIPQCQLWAVTDEKGDFIIKGVPEGLHTLVVSCLGYCKCEIKLPVKSDCDTLHIRLSQDNLALSEVVVTAHENKHNTATSYIIDKKALEHHQMVNVNSLSTLLPGGKSATNNNLATSDQRFEIRATSGELGNPSFMTAIEVDGIRLSNNASFSETAGSDVRNVATSNIESVEVITGIPSVEYGDVSGGVVKINTRKGRAPLQANVTVSPRTRSVSASQGLNLGKERGTLNMSLERTVSVAALASPHTNYSRNGLSLTWSNTLAKNTGKPLSLQASLTGNIGGMNSEADPDAFSDTYTKQKDHTIRGSVGFDWLLNKPFLTGIEGKLSGRYADKQRKTNTNKSSSTSKVAFHGTDEGYFVATDFAKDPNADISLIPAGYWYELQYCDDRPVDYSASLKAYHNLNIGSWSNKIRIGADFNATGNMGRGIYYADPQYTPDWRPYRYSEIPFMKNSAFFAEDRMQFPIGSTSMLLTAGLRYDMTRVDGSDYGSVGAFSPRMSMVYTLIEKPEAQLIKSLRIKAGFGDAVKLPSFAILYPEPTYSQQLTFAPGALADGTTYYAYYIRPTTQRYNPGLQWQSTRQQELGAEMQLGQVRIALNAFRNKSYNGYMSATGYVPFTYKYTDQRNIEGTPIPVDDRIFSIDRETGVVTLSDRTGTYASSVLPYSERTTFSSERYATNSSPVLREGIEWTFDFGKIPALFTAFRMDGSYYHYRGVNETLIASKPASSQNMANGEPYKYIGYYTGSATAINGSEKKSMNMNLTVTTQIPRIRLLVSLRLESTLYHATQNLSESNGKQRGIILSDRDQYTGEAGNIYAGDQYIAIYPEYYVSADDMQKKIPFAEAFLQAKENDPALYNELVKMVAKSNYAYTFNRNRISPYFSANINVTKEIGKHFTVSFFAHNFLNNLSKVRSSWNQTESTLLNSNYIPAFDCGLSLKVKL